MLWITLKLWNIYLFFIKIPYDISFKQVKHFRNLFLIMTYLFMKIQKLVQIYWYKFRNIDSYLRKEMTCLFLPFFLEFNQQTVGWL